MAHVSEGIIINKKKYFIKIHFNKCHIFVIYVLISMDILLLLLFLT